MFNFMFLYDVGNGLILNEFEVSKAKVSWYIGELSWLLRLVVCLFAVGVVRVRVDDAPAGLGDGMVKLNNFSFVLLQNYPLLKCI